MRTISEYGIVLSSKDNIGQVLGLGHVMSGEMVVDEFGHLGIVLNLETSIVGIVMFNDNVLMAGTKVKRLFSTLNSSIGCKLFGNIFNAIGDELNSQNTLQTLKVDRVYDGFGLIKRYVEVKAPGIIDRQSVYEQVNTGILGVDGIMPIGQGQRQLIIGDRQTGKSTIAIMATLNQASIDLIIARYYW